MGQDCICLTSHLPVTQARKSIITSNSEARGKSKLREEKSNDEATWLIMFISCAFNKGQPDSKLVPFSLHYCTLKAFI